MKAILLAGAGSVGKTKLLEAIEQMAQQRGLRALTYKSPTRKTYAKNGFANESDQMRRLGESNHQGVQELMNHQHQVMSDYCCGLSTAVKDAVSGPYDLLVADRTPYDYSTYFCTVFQPHITLEMIQAKRLEADQAVAQVLQQPASVAYLLYFPFPAPWSEDTESSDGWRADKTGKNFVWSSLVNSELDEANRRFLSDPKWEGCKLPHFGRLDVFAENGLPEHRAASVLNLVLPNRR